MTKCDHPPIYASLTELAGRLKAIPVRAFLRLPTGTPLISAALPIGELCHEAAIALERVICQHQVEQPSSIKDERYKRGYDDGYDAAKTEQSPDIVSGDKVVERVAKAIYEAAPAQRRGAGIPDAGPLPWEEANYGTRAQAFKKAKVAIAAMGEGMPPKALKASDAGLGEISASASAARDCPSGYPSELDAFLKKLADAIPEEGQFFRFMIDVIRDGNEIFVAEELLDDAVIPTGYRKSDGRPIFGEDGPDDVGELVKPVSSEISVSDFIEEIAHDPDFEQAIQECSGHVAAEIAVKRLLPYLFTSRKPVSSDLNQRRVVCAAIYHGNAIVAGPRHYDQTMHRQIAMMEPHVRQEMHHAEQGFIDQWGKFMTRKEAFEVAIAAGQIRQKTGNPDSKELFSEDLY